MATFWRIFHHDGKSAQQCESGGGVHAPPPFTLHQNCDVRSRKERIKYLLHVVPVTVKKLIVINYKRFEFIPLISAVSGC
jgi:hypothetical protein